MSYTTTTSEEDNFLDELDAVLSNALLKRLHKMVDRYDSEVLRLQDKVDGLQKELDSHQ